LPAVAPEKREPQWTWKPDERYIWTFSADPELAKIEQEMVPFAEECLGADTARRLLHDAAIFYQRFGSHPRLAEYDQEVLHGACLNAAHTKRNRDNGSDQTQPLEFIFTKLGFPNITYCTSAEGLIERESGLWVERKGGARFDR
jgi:hypothetical protein